MPIFHVWNIFGFLQSSLVTNGALPFMSYFASERKILFLLKSMDACLPMESKNNAAWG